MQPMIKKKKKKHGRVEHPPKRGGIQDILAKHLYQVNIDFTGLHTMYLGIIYPTVTALDVGL